MAVLTVNITQVGKNLIRDALKGDVTDCQIKYVAWGDNATANPSPNTLTALGNEVGRKAVTSQASGAVGILDTIIYLSPTDANLAIKEVGFFAGVGATATPGSGVMVGRALYAVTKDATFSIQIDLTDTVTGV